MKKTMVILIGIQGSGKSTFFRRFLEPDYVHVSLDILKTRNRERLLIEECISRGQCFAIDNTNPSKADRSCYISIAKEAGYKIIGYFMESKLQACIERNNQRSGKERIPPVAIAATSNKLEIPDLSEGFDQLYFVKNDGQSMEIEAWREMK